MSSASRPARAGDVGRPKAATEHGEPAIHLWAPDGSRAVVRTTRTDGSFVVSQVGPRRLWDRVEAADAFCRRAGRPRYEQFGITATTTDQYVWYDHPDSEYRWSLPVPVDIRSAAPAG